MLAVVEVFPPDGAVDVAPRTEVRVVFGEPVFGVGPEDLVVEDAAGPRTGQVSGGPDGRTWLHVPFRDLPFGGEIRVRLGPTIRSARGARPAGGTLARFRVREHGSAEERWLHRGPDAEVAAMAWPSGRQAAVMGAVVFELDAPPAAQVLPLAGHPESFVADEVGGFTVLARAGPGPFQLEIAHGWPAAPPLATGLLASAGAFGRSEHAANARGDAAVYCYGIACFGSAEARAEEHLWVTGPRNGNGAPPWLPVALAGAGPFPLRRLAIDAEGNLFVAFVDAGTGRLRLQRHDRATGASAVLDVAGLPLAFAVAALPRRGARVLWRQARAAPGGEEHVRFALRWESGTPSPAEEVYAGAPLDDRAFAAARGGAAVAVFEQPPGQHLHLQRFEAGGGAGAPDLLAGVPPAASFALAVAPRGEAWFVHVAPDSEGDRIAGVRSRPGLPAEASRTLYRSAGPGRRIVRIAAAVDDSGRLLVVLAERGIGPDVEVRALRLR